MRKNREIYFIEDDEDTLSLMVETALNSTMEENLKRFCQHLAFNYALAGIDIYSYPMDKEIYYIEDINERGEK